MNKKIVLLAVVFAGLTSTVFTGCSDDEDSTPPVVTLNGDPAPVIDLQTNFVDLGAVATDNEDGTVIATVSGTVNEDLAGTYLLTYSATDAAGNTGTATRVVTVENSLGTDPFEGNYDCVITLNGTPVDTYSEDLSVSTTLDGALEWSKWGNYSNANAKLNIYRLGGNQVTVPQQTIVCGNPAVARTFEGSGTYTGTGAAGSMLILIVEETVNSASETFTHTYTKN